MTPSWRGAVTGARQICEMTSRGGGVGYKNSISQPRRALLVEYR